MSGYQPPSLYTSTEIKMSASDKKRDPKYIRLQVVEQEISEFNLLRYYLFGVLVSLIPHPNFFAGREKLCLPWSIKLIFLAARYDQVGNRLLQYQR